MRTITPTIVICAAGAAAAIGLLAVPAERRVATPATTTVVTPSATTAVDGPTPPTSGAIAVTSAELTVDSFAFSAVTISPGGTVRVVNLDSVDHTVTADDGSFDVLVPAGGEATFAAPAAAGAYSFFCGIHPSMTGVLSVT